MLKDLYEHVVPTIADKWRDVGVQLLDSNLLDQRILEVIAADHPHSVEECCKCNIINMNVETNVDFSISHQQDIVSHY